MIRLPELFQVIIQHDLSKPCLAGPVVDWTAYRKWVHRKGELRRAAQAFIKRQRGNGGSAGAGG